MIVWRGALWLATALSGAASTGACQRPDDGATHIELRGAGADAPLPRLHRAGVEAMAIVGANPVALERQGDRWVMTAPEHGPVDARAIEGALGELERLEWNAHPVATAATSWARFGVAAADVVTIAVRYRGAPLPPLHLGASGHARIGERDAVWRALHIDRYTFDRELRLWRDRRALSLDLASVTGLTVADGAGRRLALERIPAEAPAEDEAAAAATWRVLGAAGSDAKAAVRAESTLPHLAEIDAWDVADPSAARAEPAVFTFTVRAGGDEHTAALHGPAGDRRRYLTIAGDERAWIVTAGGVADLDTAAAALLDIAAAP